MTVTVASTGNDTCMLASGRGVFHNLKVVVNNKPGSQAPARPSFRLRVALDPEGAAVYPARNAGRQEERDLLAFVRERACVSLESYEQHILLLKATTGPIHILSGRTSAPAAMKVSTTEVFLAVAIRIIEQPSLHAIGDHLWHSSLVMASYLLSRQHIKPAALVLELGAGCGLVSLAAAACGVHSSCDIIASDLPDIVESTLSASLAANAALASGISAQFLIWGEDLAPSLRQAIARHQNRLTIYASDVLYNSGSHEVFLQTLIALAAAAVGGMEVWIAYRHRIAGDDDFWVMAESAMMPFERVHQIADIQLWRYCSSDVKQVR